MKIIIIKQTLMRFYANFRLITKRRKYGRQKYIKIKTQQRKIAKEEERTTTS